MNFTNILAVVLAVIVLSEASKIHRVSRGTKNAWKGPRFSLANLANSLSLGRNNGFRTVNHMGRTAKGIKRCRLTQTYFGYEVFGSAVEAEADMSGELTGQVYGDVVLDIADSIPDAEACTRDINDIYAIAMQEEGVSPDDSTIDEKDGKRLIYVDPDTHESIIAYRVEFFYKIGKMPSKPAYFIAACDDRVLLSFNQINNMTLDREVRQATEACETDPPVTTAPPGQACTPSVAGEGGNTKVGKTIYNSTPFCLRVQKSGSRCTMQSKYSKVVDNQQTTDRGRSTAVEFTCTQGYSDPINGAYGPATDAMYYGDVTGRLYEEKYNFRALSWTPRLVVHYDSCFDNAFWNGRDMFFGDGCSYFYPLVSQDVVAHELGHGITSTNSDLVYSGQSGGINEAFSDLSGEVAEKFGSGSYDWKVGYMLRKGSGSLRYFVNPPDDRRSIKHVDDYYSGMDVHHSSGIYNHAFYQMVEIEGLDIYDAYECFLHANRFIWGPRTNFAAGACNVMQACFDIGVDHTKVATAFGKVGINLNSCDYSSLTTSVSSGETRNLVQVSATRNPIFKMEVTGGSKIVEVLSSDFSVVKIEVASDPGVTNVIASGDNVVEFSSGGNDVYVKLSSTSAKQTDVTMTFV